MRRLILLTLILCAAMATVAVAKTKHGITPKTPKAGAVVPAGSGLFFTGKVKGKGTMFVRVSKKKKRYRDGVIGKGVDITSAKRNRKKGTFLAIAEKFTFPTYYLNTPGTYYWQAYKIDCIRTNRGDRLDCLQEGPVQKFIVR